MYIVLALQVKSMAVEHQKVPQHIHTKDGNSGVEQEVPALLVTGSSKRRRLDITTSRVSSRHR